ncbi:hypothetical protein LNKW23_38400 [Paralimibaculum aggregatum]|uniref:Uncharacterized protein n=1 Tax=Paralimibaculum aggregatum TaxID=3036245 RepID=A0ABQ6LPX3_9RHOB|nr:hypothetical protein LNKW23_38400 [Limibaculum sp. NKW23]
MRRILLPAAGIGNSSDSEFNWRGAGWPPVPATRARNPSRPGRRRAFPSGGAGPARWFIRPLPARPPDRAQRGAAAGVVAGHRAAADGARQGTGSVAQPPERRAKPLERRAPPGAPRSRRRGASHSFTAPVIAAT